MAGSTFLTLTNKLLTRLNEVNVTQTEFAGVTNVQAAARDSVLAAIAEINTSEYRWPWHKQTGTAVADVGVVEFTFGGSADVAVPDWNSFYIQADPVNNITFTQLSGITREEYYRFYRDIDLNSVANGGKRKPAFVFPALGGFGVAPMPDKQYTIKYEFYAPPAELQLYSDVCAIPSIWDSVIIDVALKHFYMYKDNTEQASYWSNKADKSIFRMRSFVVNRQDHIWSNMNNFGGRRFSVDYTKV